ncbi:MAG TPA: efflux RND transporter periplasmic adaptor subunit [Thermoflexia bacterium]|nr:efflux RND transporter periplasmic adaptor subunit [Thermoflexia bacterium]
MKRGTMILIGLVALALIGTASYFGFRSTQPAAVPTPSAPRTVPVTRGDVRQTVNAPGQLVTTRQVDLTLDVSGRLAEVPVRPGDSVQEGDVLARLETGPLEQAVAQADLNVRLAQLDLAAAREGPSEAELAAARAAVRDAKVELEVARHAYSATLNSALDSAVRSRKIEFDWYVGYYQGRKAEYEAGHLSQSDHDHAMNAMISAEGRLNEAIERARMEELQAQNRVDQAESALYQAWQRLQLLQSGPLTKTIMRAELEVDRALLAREKARADLEAAVLRAPFDGVVLEVNAAPGDRISAGATLITLMDPTALEARVTVIEEDLPLIEAGQPVELFVDALPDASLRGQVARIIPQSVPGESPRYPVYISLDDGWPAVLAPGMTVDASIVIAERQDVLTLPRALLRARSDGTAQVKVWVAGQVEERTVRVGLRGDLRVEILEGLREGEQVVGE